MYWMIEPLPQPAPFDWRSWLLPAVLAFGMHVFFLWLVIGQSEAPAFPVAQTIRVSLVQLATPKKPAPPPAKVEKEIKSVEQPEPAEKPMVKDEAPASQPVSKAVQRAVAPSSEPKPDTDPSEASKVPVADPQPAIPDSSPDYSVVWLHNNPPRYPHAARRRGLEGRVVLHVEVLAAGSCGHIELLQSSGHEILDEAAIKAVKHWRFVPARHLGFAVSSWLNIPIRFELTARQ